MSLKCVSVSLKYKSMSLKCVWFPLAVVFVCAIISICMRRRAQQQMQMVQMHQVPL